jgi:flavin reductase (DIM6/NTAB) family NADH-FMN oxidoreductase RutF
LDTETKVRTSPPFDGLSFRRILGRYPTGVVAVTSLARDSAVGVAVGSFMSLSLEPPLIAFGIGCDSTTWPHIDRAGLFCVNVLSESQQDLCLAMSMRGGDKFSGVDWVRSRSGPRIRGCLAWLDCETEFVHEIGDHYLVVGRVHCLEAGEDGPGPLVFYQRSFGSFRHLATA